MSTSTSKRPPEARRGGIDVPMALAVLAVVLAGSALAVGLLNLVGAGRSNCQDAAWNAVPAADRLPDGWQLGGTDFYPDAQSTTLVSPTADAEAGDGFLFVSVTCYGGTSGEALDRARTSAEKAGNTVDDLSVGDDGYSSIDSSGNSVYHFRRGALLAYINVSGTVDPVALYDAAGAVDTAMAQAQGGGVPAARPTAIAGRPTATTAPGESASPGGEPTEVPIESTEPAASPVAPALEAILPGEVNGTPLTKDSITGDVIVGDDTASRALVASLRTLGKQPEALLIAQAYDEAGVIDASILAFQLPGVDGATLRTTILGSWLMANTAGVTSTEMTLGGATVTKVSFGDAGSNSYVAVHGDAVVVIDTTDEALAGKIIAGLK